MYSSRGTISGLPDLHHYGKNQQTACYCCSRDSISGLPVIRRLLSHQRTACYTPVVAAPADRLLCSGRGSQQTTCLTAVGTALVDRMAHSYRDSTSRRVYRRVELWCWPLCGNNSNTWRLISYRMYAVKSRTEWKSYIIFVLNLPRMPYNMTQFYLSILS
jgi:hypothetical protein